MLQREYCHNIMLAVIRNQKLNTTTITNMALQFKVMNMLSVSLGTAASERVILL